MIDDRILADMDRNVLISGVLLLCGSGLVSDVEAQLGAANYPSRPIVMIVPFPPGGPTDVLGRTVAQGLSQQLGSVVVENRSGAGGTIGMAALVKAPADGHTIAMGGSSNITVAPSLYPKLPYDPLRDLVPVANVAAGPYVLAVHSNVPARSVGELIKLARTKDGFLTYGSAGPGSNSNLAGELFQSMARIKLVQVPYRGAGLLVTGLLVGEIDIIIADFSALAPSARTGKLRMLAAIGSKRLAAAPDLPIMSEAGVPGYAIDVWFGIVAPVGTPPDIVAALNNAIVNGLKAPDVRDRLGKLGYETIGGTPEQFSATIRADIEKFRRIVRDSGVKAE